jgi:5-methylcytosine-specific restriction endonuclease McrA
MTGLLFPKGEPMCLRAAALKRQDELAWRALKARVTKRDLKRCRVCLKAGADHHHILSRSLGGRDTDANVLLLCRECHQHRHAGLIRITGNAMEQVSVWFDERIKAGAGDRLYLR